MFCHFLGYNFLVICGKDFYYGWFFSIFSDAEFGCSAVVPYIEYIVIVRFRVFGFIDPDYEAGY